MTAPLHIAPVPCNYSIFIKRWELKNTCPRSCWRLEGTVLLRQNPAGCRRSVLCPGYSVLIAGANVTEHYNRLMLGLGIILHPSILHFTFRIVGHIAVLGYRLSECTTYVTVLVCLACARAYFDLVLCLCKHN